MARALTKIMQRVDPALAARQTDADASPESSTPFRITPVDADLRRMMIAEAAYFRSLGHAGSDIEDWLEAEQEVDAKVMAASSR